MLGLIHVGFPKYDNFTYGLAQTDIQVIPKLQHVHVQYIIYFQLRFAGKWQVRDDRGKDLICFVFPLTINMPQH